MKDELQLKTRDVEFLLYEVFCVQELVKNERYSHHDRETFKAVIELAKDFAEQKFYPLARPLDQNEPYLKDNKVVTIPELKKMVKVKADIVRAIPLPPISLKKGPIPICPPNRIHIQRGSLLRATPRYLFSFIACHSR